MLKTAVFFTILAFGAYAFPNGSPTTSCETMVPQHSADPQPLPDSPYTVTATAIDADRFEVTIGSTVGAPFRGFLIQARSAFNNTAVGSFEAAENAKSIRCFSNVDSASTNLDGSDKSSVTVIWNAPESGEEVQFLATVVQTSTIFWVRIPATVAN
ncbi:putative defense protein 3 [Cloeon dipterum]|uniref:putative defense protein 3 n=1 Tax=Cloeon dipterum TaxID=197152 RepID=UPI00321FE1B2